MATIPVETHPETSSEPLAPWWHSFLVLLPLAAMSIASWYQHGLPNLHFPGLGLRVSGYVTVLLAESLDVLLIWLALRHRGLSLGTLVEGRWHTPVSFFRDLGLSLAFLVVIVPLTGLLVHLLGAASNISQADITPKTLPELLLWLVLASTAGFAEELIFRGYLMRQFHAWTGSRLSAVLLQGVLFGLAHGFYGRAMFAVMVHGCLLGLLVSWRRSLLPAILAHGLQDTIGGVVAFLSSR